MFGIQSFFKSKQETHEVPWAGTFWLPWSCMMCVFFNLPRLWSMHSHRLLSDQWIPRIWFPSAVDVYWYIYICMYIYISGERVWSPQCFCWLECAQCVYSWTLMVSGDLWNVHNFCDTCTTSVTRAQYLWNVHNISDTCTTSLKRTPIIPLSWSSIKCRCFDSIKCCSGTHFIEDWLGRL